MAKLLVLGPAVSFASGASGSWLMTKVDANMGIRQEHQALYGVDLVLASYTAATTARSQTQIREVMAGCSSGSQNMLAVHFGLGQHSQVDTLNIRWPSGIVQTLTGVAPNQAMTVIECDSD